MQGPRIDVVWTKARHGYGADECQQGGRRRGRKLGKDPKKRIKEVQRLVISRVQQGEKEGTDKACAGRAAKKMPHPCRISR